MRNSIRWRITLIYLLLILLSMELVGAFLLQSLEKYFVSSFVSSLNSRAQLVAGLLERYMLPQPDKDKIDAFIAELSSQSEADIAVLSATGAFLTASVEDPEGFRNTLSQSDAAIAIAGGSTHAFRADPVSGKRALHVVSPIKSQGKVVGAVYMVASMEGTYRVIGDVRMILLYGTALALGVAAALGYVLARTMVEPIEQLTAGARAMAAGNFGYRIQVNARDEIGELGNVFNMMAARLSKTLEDISNEKAKLEAILSNMADGVIAVDADGRVITVNDTAKLLLGGNPPETVLSGEILSRVQRERSVESRQLKVGDRSIRAVYAPFMRGSGEPAGSVVVLQDTTEQVRLDEMRRDFVANVSHEFKTPLTTIKSYVETILDGELDSPESQRKFLETVLAETDRLAKLVRELLELSRLDSGQVQWKKEPLDMVELARQIAERLAPQIKAKGLNLTIDGEAAPRAIGDGDGISRVLSNLLSNAIAFTPEGGKIAVRVRPYEGGRMVLTEVEDTGIGIPQECLPRMFERFYRVDKGRSRAMGGTGLGLAISKQIVEGHGGRIWIESALGVGTKVSFVLPAS
ncbi:MAG: ATP-binding protein [Bacillota bacterium]